MPTYKDYLDDIHSLNHVMLEIFKPTPLDGLYVYAGLRRARELYRRGDPNRLPD